MTRLDEIKENVKYVSNILPKVAGCGFEETRDYYLEDVSYLVSRVEKLEAALKFYADEKNYYDGRPKIVVGGGYVAPDNFTRADFLELDIGDIARAALSDSDEEMKSGK